MSALPTNPGTALRADGAVSAYRSREHRSATEPVPNARRSWPPEVDGGMREALAACRDGDTLVVTKLDRLAGSLPDARAILEDLTHRHVRLSLGGSVHDPTDPVGRLLFNVLAMVAEFEADLIRLRTREGMKVRVTVATVSPSPHVRALRAAARRSSSARCSGFAATCAARRHAASAAAG